MITSNHPLDVALMETLDSLEKQTEPLIGWTKLDSDPMSIYHHERKLKIGVKFEVSRRDNTFEFVDEGIQVVEAMSTAAVFAPSLLKYIRALHVKIDQMHDVLAMRRRSWATTGMLVVGTINGSFQATHPGLVAGLIGTLVTMVVFFGLEQRSKEF